MSSPVPQFPQRNLFSSSSPQPTTLQIIRRVAERERALESSHREEMTQASEAAEDDVTSDARSTFQQRTSALQEQIQALSFGNVDDLARANELLASVLSLKDEIERYHEPIKRPLKEAHAAACKAEHDDLDPVVALEKKLKQGIAALDLKIRQLEAEAARVRQQAAAEASSAMQQQMIEAARQSGASEEVLASLGAMEILVPVVETESFARPKGYSTRDQFEVEVTDILLLAQAVVAGSMQKEVLQANTKLLAAMAKASNGDLEIPGVRISKKVSVTGRKAR
ncbi:MAG: hypothetical protein JO108_04335 [Acidobacteriaceae bacterium]|nr:hypothetical protein [Acidobacteriaceae bacterium]